MTSMTLQDVADLFVPVPDFPEKGILFWNVGDVTTDAEAYACVTNALTERCKQWERVTSTTIDYIAGFDARGFIFGGVVAQMLGIGFLQVRKKGKLPPPLESIEYTMEYGEEDADGNKIPKVLQMNTLDLTGKTVVLIDDLLATGGTAGAGCQLIEKMGGTVGFFLTVTELPLLGGRVHLQHYAVETLLTEINNKLRAGVRNCIDAIINNPATEKLLLIDRLSAPVGYAMVGGGIEIGESAVEALIREVREETACGFRFEDFKFHTVLIGADRDPRGDQVSLVYKVQADTEFARGEEGKTEMFPVPNRKDALPSPEEWAFSDHATTVSDAAA